MNKDDRKKIAKLIEELQELNGKFDDIKDQIVELQSDEQGKFDNMSEGFQASERGQAIEAAADALDSAKDEIDTVIGAIGECVTYLETASE